MEHSHEYQPTYSVTNSLLLLSWILKKKKQKKTKPTYNIKIIFKKKQYMQAQIQLTYLLKETTHKLFFFDSTKNRQTNLRDFPSLRGQVMSP